MENNIQSIYKDQFLNQYSIDGLIFENQILTTQEAANYLKVSRKTIMKMIHNGEIPVKKVGKNYRFLMSALEGWLKGE